MQLVGLFVSSIVTTFHRRGDSMVRDTDKNGEGDRRDRLREDGGETGARQGNRREGEREPVLCRAGSGLLLSPLPCIPDGTGCRKEKESAVGRLCQLGRSGMVKYHRQVLSLPCSMRRRSLRLLSPGHPFNPGGDTGTFFRAENYRREFFARKPQA